MLPTNGDWNEGAAPRGTTKPYGVLSLVPSPAIYDWTGVVHELIVDIVVFSLDSGEAASLDQLMFTTLQDARLAVTGLTSLSCRRLGVISLQDVDEEGNTVYMAGGSWRIRVSQSRAGLQTLTVSVDMTIA
jgi:hypothetical protein